MNVNALTSSLQTFINASSFKIGQQPTGGLAIWWLDVVSIGILSLSASVSADVILLGFCLLASSFVFLLDCGSGLTIFKFHHIAKPCPLPATLCEIVVLTETH